MKIVISSGHGKYISGAVGYIKEHEEAVRVVDEVARNLRSVGVETITYEDTVSKTQDENLNRIVSFHNGQGAHDYDISVHFNANATTSSPVGTECWYLSQKEFAAKVATGIAKASTLKDRGPKYSGGLYFLAHTAAKSILIEVCFVDSKADTDIYKRTFAAICAAIATAISGQNVQPGSAPPAKPETPPEAEVPWDGRPTIGKGDKGPAVEDLQKIIGVLKVDGDFGDVTATWVRAFQSACGLTPDGIVGQQTWDEVEDLDNRVTDGADNLLPAEVHDAIYTAAQTSEIADYSWPDRGIAPKGYIAGMALSYAYAISSPLNPRTNGEAIAVMQRAEGSADKDALALYKDEFNKLGMSNSTPGMDTMRHLWVLMIGLGPRESSGRYFEGRDLSADNVQAETCEAGLFQTSWNIKAAHASIAPLLPRFWANPNGFAPEFREGLSPSSNNLSCYGSGDGARYQWLSRFCPLFTCLVTGVGLRTLRAHWGPIGRKEVTIKKEADELLQEVQRLVQAGV